MDKWFDSPYGEIFKPGCDSVWLLRKREKENWKQKERNLANLFYFH